MGDPDRIATSKQLDALRKFDCKIPDKLTVGEASAWLDHLTGKLRRHETITDIDLSGPPVFHSPKPPATPPEASAPPGGETTPPQPAEAVDPLPVSDEWVTIEVARDEPQAGGVVIHRSTRFAAHPAPGETYERTAARLMKKAEAAVGA